MSGIAFVLPGCDFSAKNLGKVTFLEDANITGIAISGSDSVNGLSSQYSVGYNPANTSQRGVTWSVITGSQYATIDASTGLLTILSGASSSAVTIKAISTVDNTIIATKSITVTYVEAPILLTALSISGSDIVAGTTFQYSVGYTPENTTQQGVAWSITSGSQYATIDASTGLLTILSGARSSSVTIKATSTVNTSISVTKTIATTYSIVPVTYQLPASFQGNGTSTSFDTGIKLFDSTAKEWTILASVTVPLSIAKSSDASASQLSYFSCFNENSPYFGLLYRYSDAVAEGPKGYAICGDNAKASILCLTSSSKNNVIAISKNSAGVYTIYGNDFAAASQVLTSQVSNTMNNTLHLGCEINGSGAPFRFNNLIINDLKYFDSVLTDTQIKAFLNQYPVSLS